MDELEISYEITPDDFVHSNRLLGHSAVYSRQGKISLVFSAMILLVAWTYYMRYGDNDSLWLLLLAPGGYLLYCGAIWLFPSLWIKSQYDTSLAGQIFTARFSPGQVTVSGNTKSWSHKWAAFRSIAEDHANLKFRRYWQSWQYWQFFPVAFLPARTKIAVLGILKCPANRWYREFPELHWRQHESYFVR